MARIKDAAGWLFSPFFRSELDMMSGGGSREDSEDDLDDAPPRDGDSDEDEHTRPGEYPESESEDDREDTVDEEGEYGDDDDEDALGGRDPDRSWKSIAKEEQRRRRKAEERYEDRMFQLAQGGGAGRQGPEPAKPSPPPYTADQIVEAQAEGNFQEAMQMQGALEIWKEQKLRSDLATEATRNAELGRLESRITKRLSFQGDDPFARAVRDRRKDLMADYPSMSPLQATLLASGEIGAEVGKSGPRKDLRGDSKRRNARRNAGRSTPDTRSRVENDGRLRVTDNMRTMLKRADLEHYLSLARSSNPKVRKEYRGKIRRLAERIGQVQEGDI